MLPELPKFGFVSHFRLWCRVRVGGLLLPMLSRLPKFGFVFQEGVRGQGAGIEAGCLCCLSCLSLGLFCIFCGSRCRLAAGELKGSGTFFGGCVCGGFGGEG